MKKNSKHLKRTVSLAVAAILALGLTACGNDSSAANANAGSNGGQDVRTITVCAAPGFFPITYADDDGNAAGYDVEVFKAIDELLPQYEFKFELADKETLNVGVQTGTYQVGINMLFRNAEREETYLIPEHNMGNATIVLLYNANAEPVTGFQDVYDRGLKIYPTTPAGGIPQVINRWNEAHPDAQVEIELDSSTNTGDSLAAIQAGEYDVSPTILQVYALYPEEAVVGLTYSDPVDLIHTYPIVNKNETELYEAIDESLAKLYEDGTLSRISNEIFGYDVFELQ